MGRESFQKLCRNIKPQEFELLLAYIQNSIELAPYDKASLGPLCPHDMRLYKSIVCPIELMLTPEKDNIFKKFIQPLGEALGMMIKEIKDSDLAKNSFFYNKHSKRVETEVKRGDIVLVLGNMGEDSRTGVIVTVNKSSVEVRFSNGRINTFAKTSVVLLVRNPEYMDGTLAEQLK